MMAALALRVERSPTPSALAKRAPALSGVSSFGQSPRRTTLRTLEAVEAGRDLGEGQGQMQRFVDLARQLVHGVLTGQERLGLDEVEVMPDGPVQASRGVGGQVPFPGEAMTEKLIGLNCTIRSRWRS